MNFIPLINFGIVPGKDTPLRLLLTGDILHFAAIAYFCCALLKKYVTTLYEILIAYFILLVIAPYTWHIQPGNNVAVHHAVSLLNGEPPYSYFPLFPWILYPLAGVCCGAFISNKEPVAANWLFIKLMIVFFVLGGLTLQLEPEAWNHSFYRLGRGGILIHTATAMGWIVLLTTIGRYIFSFSLLQWLSKHISAAYIIQWVIVCWCFAFWNYASLNLKQSCWAITITTSGTLLFTYLYTLLLTKHSTT